mmetsp:Transcript_21400/g.67136  ORF Transcript_21400/g.67136 Transcript_21400/m.67136 type:complete len:313 (-) Transcript_21400:75-1013(-)
MKTSRKLRPCSSCRFRASSRSARYGETSVTSVITPPPLNRQAISPTRLTDSRLSAGENPRSRFRPVRTLSPSSCWTCFPCFRTSSSSRARAIVDLPEPESPVIHSVMPFCPSASYRRPRGRWHASCDPPSPASAHSMMFGGVAASAAARYAPMSNSAGAAGAAAGPLASCCRSFSFSSNNAANDASGITLLASGAGCCCSCSRSLAFSLSTCCSKPASASGVASGAVPRSCGAAAYTGSATSGVSSAAGIAAASSSARTAECDPLVITTPAPITSTKIPTHTTGRFMIGGVANGPLLSPPPPPPPSSVATLL